MRHTAVLLLVLVSTAAVMAGARRVGLNETSEVIAATIFAVVALCSGKLLQKRTA